MHAPCQEAHRRSRSDLGPVPRPPGLYGSTAHRPDGGPYPLAVSRTSGGNRRGHEQWAMTVTSVTDLHPRLRRLTFAAEEFATFAAEGPDECFGWLLPTGDRPHLRWYTVRPPRPARAEIDVDVVLHGDEGPASRFAAEADVGATAGFRSSGAAYAPPAGGPSQLPPGE